MTAVREQTSRTAPRLFLRSAWLAHRAVLVPRATAAVTGQPLSLKAG